MLWRRAGASVLSLNLPPSGSSSPAVPTPFLVELVHVKPFRRDPKTTRGTFRGDPHRLNFRVSKFVCLSRHTNTPCLHTTFGVRKLGKFVVLGTGTVCVRHTNLLREFVPLGVKGVDNPLISLSLNVPKYPKFILRDIWCVVRHTAHNLRVIYRRS